MGQWRPATVWFPNFVQIIVWLGATWGLVNDDFYTLLLLYDFVCTVDFKRRYFEESLSSFCSCNRSRRQPKLFGYQRSSIYISHKNPISILVYFATKYLHFNSHQYGNKANFFFCIYMQSNEWTIHGLSLSRQLYKVLCNGNSTCLIHILRSKTEFSHMHFLITCIWQPISK